MEIETRIGPGATPRVIETIEIGEDYLIESTPAGDNYVTTWVVAPDGDGALVEAELRFEYGGALIELLVARQVRRALRQQLQRLKAVAEASGTKP
jgi:hypothetical protein